MKNHIADFDASYKMKSKKTVSLNEARCLVMSIAETYLKAINENEKIKNVLDEYPLNTDRLSFNIHFTDENEIALEHGIASVGCYKNKLWYKTFSIEQYDTGIPHFARGKY